MTKKFIPAISVVIPMYNTEKYIGECLESIFAQTFQDFEIIVVDNCSTDRSCEVVENYVEKFGDKIKLIRRKKNSGGDGQPRNDGIKFSRGEYFFFMDSDDVIVEDAFEKLYKIAENFQADVIHCEKYFRAPGNTVTTDKKILKEFSDEKVEFVKEPTFISDDLTARIEEIGKGRLIGYPWLNFVSRELVAMNNIEFPLTRCGADHIFFVKILCLAKKFLRIPDCFYVWRQNSESITRKTLNPADFVHRWTDSLFRGSKILADFMNDFEVFKNNPEYIDMVFESLIALHTAEVIGLYSKMPRGEMDKLIVKELEQLEDTTALTAFLFGRMSIFNINFMRQQQIIFRQQEEIKNLQEQLQNLKITSPNS